MTRKPVHYAQDDASGKLVTACGHTIKRRIVSMWWAYVTCPECLRLKPVKD